MMKLCDEAQIKGLVRERNEYKRLLDECLFALDTLPMQKINDGDGGDTKKLAFRLRKSLRLWSQGVCKS